MGTDNDLAVKHGAFSPKLLEPIAAAIREQALLDDSVAYLREPRFAGPLHRYSLTAARVVRLEAWIEDMTDEEAARSDRGQTSPLELLRRWTVTADRQAARLGLDPVSWVKIRKDYKIGTRVDLATLLSNIDDAPDKIRSGDVDAATVLSYRRMQVEGADGE
ncbi:hypothetical protein GCM10027568_11030 [Humibacter soli]